MTRVNDHDTSIEAAASVEPKRTALQLRVLAILAGGPMTAGEMECLPALRHLAPSTVRKRISELYQLDVIEKRGRGIWRGSSMTLWGMK